MKRLQDTLNDSKGLRDILNGNPDLPIVFEIEDEVVCDDMHETFAAPHASYSVGEVLDYRFEDGTNPFDGVFTDRRRFKEALECFYVDEVEDLNDLTTVVEGAMRLFEPYWMKCIIVRCTT